jgi:predicted RNase H-related nuclease YkuK (DUF458 family)
MDTIFTKETKFMTGSFEPITLSDIVGRIDNYLSDGYEYNIEIGTDSQRGSNKVKFVTAIAVHKIGKGGIFFYHPTVTDTIHTLSDRIYMETGMSINCANVLIDLFVQSNVLHNITIHCDVGHNGRTKELIQGIVGYVTASGFGCCIKPDATTASCIADKFSK